MKRAVLFAVVLLLCLVVAPSAFAGQEVFNFSGWGKVTLSLPAGWEAGDVFSQDAPRTVKVRRTGDDSLMIMIGPLPVPGGKMLGTQEAANAFLKEAGKGFSSGSLEKAMHPKPLGSPNGLGSYAVLTDASLADVPPPPPGNYRLLTLGLLSSGRETCGFTILSNETTSDTYRKAFAIVREGLQLSPP